MGFIFTFYISLEQIKVILWLLVIIFSCNNMNDLTRNCSIALFNLIQPIYRQAFKFKLRHCMSTAPTIHDASKQWISLLGNHDQIGTFQNASNWTTDHSKRMTHASTTFWTSCNIVNSVILQGRGKVSLFTKNKHNLQSCIVRLGNPSSQAIASQRCVHDRRGLSWWETNASTSITCGKFEKLQHSAS